jgi:hypothetical protein
MAIWSGRTVRFSSVSIDVPPAATEPEPAVCRGPALQAPSASSSIVASEMRSPWITRAG